ncbi:MAG TPA: GNAT family N-acetyltransferase [Acidimicrobiales bacterium]|nr:GNAT family N-acetyltransferase [Acidimicrobiales bacterium]
MKVEVFDGPASELAEALRTLVPQLSTSNPPPTVAQVEAMLGSDAISQFVARDGAGAIIGVATLAVFPIPTSRRGWIEDVIVDDAARGQGAGAALTRAMIDRARALGCSTLELTSRPSREVANRLYQRLGFTLRDTNVYRFDLRS